jgi:hypothetical protein
MLSEHVGHSSSTVLPPNRSFGFLFAFVFLVAGGWPYLKVLVGCVKHWQTLTEACPPVFLQQVPNLWALITSGVFLLAALVYPRVLAPLNRLWMAFGNLLHIMVGSLVLGILFVLVITPLGLLMRAMGRDALALKRDGSACTYWIQRMPPGPDPKTLFNQF